MVHSLTFLILFCSLSVQRLSGLKIVSKQEQPRERGKVWQQIADNLNSDHTLKFPTKKFGGFRETEIIAGKCFFQ